MTALVGAIGLLGALVWIAVWIAGRITSRRAALRLASSSGELAVAGGASGPDPSLDVEWIRAGEGRTAGLLAAIRRRIDGPSVLFVLAGFTAGFFLARRIAGLSGGIALAVGLDLAILVGLVLATRAERRALQLESQLATWLRLVSAGLRAGAGRVDALGQALGQVGDPLARVLSGPVGRLRLGEEPEKVFARLHEAVPLESFRLFSLVLSAQWHAGGSLQNTLGSIGEALQDRVDVARRIQTQSAPTRSSVLTLIAATGAIALFSHSNDPENLERFLRSAWGDALIASALALQGGALVWIWRLTRTRL